MNVFKQKKGGKNTTSAWEDELGKMSGFLVLLLTECGISTSSRDLFVRERDFAFFTGPRDTGYRILILHGTRGCGIRDIAFCTGPRDTGFRILHGTTGYGIRDLASSRTLEGTYITPPLRTISAVHLLSTRRVLSSVGCLIECSHIIVR